MVSFMNKWKIAHNKKRTKLGTIFGFLKQKYI